MIFPFMLSASAPTDEPHWNCKEPVVQQEMNWCAQQDFLKADAQLNAQWKKTVAVMKARDADWDANFDNRPAYFATLLRAQRAWLKYRDAHCASEGYLARGGSMEPLLVSSCEAQLTWERTQQLKGLAETDN